MIWFSLVMILVSVELLVKNNHMSIEKKYKDLNQTFNVDSEIVISEKENPISKIEIDSTQDDIKKDYEYTRANLYSLIEKGQEAINGIMELAGEGGSPKIGRAHV